MTILILLKKPWKKDVTNKIELFNETCLYFILLLIFALKANEETAGIREENKYLGHLLSITVVILFSYNM